MMNEGNVARWIGQFRERMLAAREARAAQANPPVGETLVARRSQRDSEAGFAELVSARESAKDGDRDAEIAHYRKAIELQPDQPFWVYRNLADACWESGDREAGLNYLRESIKREAVPLAGYRRLARRLQPGEDLDALLADAEQVADCSATQQFALAKLLIEQGRTKPAAACLRRCLEDDPEYFPAMHRLCLLLAREGDCEAALSLAAELVAKAFPNGAYLATYGRLLKASGDLVGAESWLRKAMDLTPAHLAFQFELVALLMDQGNEEEARRLSRDILDSSPDELRFRRLVRVFELGQETVATEYFRAWASARKPSASEVERVRDYWVRSLPMRMGRLAGSPPLVRFQLRLMAFSARGPDWVCKWFLNGARALSQKQDAV